MPPVIPLAIGSSLDVWISALRLIGAAGVVIGIAMVIFGTRTASPSRGRVALWVALVIFAAVWSLDAVVVSTEANSEIWDFVVIMVKVSFLVILAVVAVREVRRRAGDGDTNRR